MNNCFNASYTSTAVLMDKGIIIGVEHESAVRLSLPFVMFRIVTSVRQPLSEPIYTVFMFDIDSPVHPSCVKIPSWSISGPRGC